MLTQDLLGRLKSQLALLEKTLVGNVPAFIKAQVLGYEELDEDDYEELGVLEFLDKPQLLQEVEAALRNKYVSGLPKDQGRTFHIGYQPTGVNEAMERTKALKKTAMDLHVKDYESMSASALIAAIEPLMVCCYDILRLREKLECCKGNDDALVILVEDMVPCLLHLKKNTQEALITLILNDVYSEAHRPDLTTQAARKQTVEQAVSIINSRGMHKFQASQQWEVPFLKAGAGVGRVSMEVYLGAKVIRRVGEEVIDICVTQGSRNQQVKELMRCYIQLMDELDKVGEFDDERIFSLSHMYYDYGIKLWNREFIGNYAHIVGSGHALEFMQRGIFLKLWEQQAVEGFVKLLKNLYHNKTSKGGGMQVEGAKRGVQQQSPRMVTLFEICFRRYGWFHGHLQKFFSPANSARAVDQPTFLLQAFPDDVLPVDDPDFEPADESDSDFEDEDDDLDMDERDNLDAEVAEWTWRGAKTPSQRPRGPFSGLACVSADEGLRCMDCGS